MSTSRSEAEKLLRASGLRVTRPRVAVLLAVTASKGPVSHSELVSTLNQTDWDPATVYRNLIKLRDAGLISVVARANGIDRYAAASHHSHDHNHPHFVCDDCGQVSCLPIEVTPALSDDDRWAQSLRQAAIQLRGECPDCLEGVETVAR